jgi:hypothetical protein
MINGKRLKYVSNTDVAARRFYIQRFANIPPDLLGTKMEKEKYLNALTKKTLRIIGVQPPAGRARS